MQNILKNLESGLKFKIWPKVKKKRNLDSKEPKKELLRLAKSIELLVALVFCNEKSFII